MARASSLKLAWCIAEPNVSPGVQENAATTGDFDLTEANRTITIQGQGLGTIVDGRKLDRVFQVFANVTVVLRDLVIRNGLARDNGFDGSTEEAPNEYGHVWVNGLGEHIYTNESSYNPNVGSNLDWREMPEKN